jgi:chromosome condensin MukBEF MukE localization factor
MKRRIAAKNKVKHSPSALLRAVHFINTCYSFRQGSDKKAVDDEMESQRRLAAERRKQTRVEKLALQKKHLAAQAHANMHTLLHAAPRCSS